MSADLPTLASIVTTDFTAITRGRPVRFDRLEKYRAGGIGWVPANISLTPFNLIADPNPWGSAGDLRILPDLDAVFFTDATGAATPFAMVPGDVVELDGAPWSCCSRSFLKRAIEDLEAETGLSVISAFEQEFQVSGASLEAAHPFSVRALRRADGFASTVLLALEQAGVDPEMFLAEYGDNQFEVTHGPANALTAADRAVAIREIVREIAANRGWRACFAPKTSLAGVGNGVHIHVSLVDAAGKPATYDANDPHGLSQAAGSFAAGILRHMRALTVFTAPGPSSYYRLQPHYWSAAWTWLGEKDREASLRICPVLTLGGKDPAGQFNLEYRAADATGNPYLSLGVLIRAGLEGLRQKLPAPPVFSGDPALLSADERVGLGLYRLPGSLQEAIEAYQADETVRSWFPPVFEETYLGVKREELKIVDGNTADTICAMYRDRY